jgi:hypothetical protein
VCDPVPSRCFERSRQDDLSGSDHSSTPPDPAVTWASVGPGRCIFEGAAATLRSRVRATSRTRVDHWFDAPVGAALSDNVSDAFGGLGSSVEARLPSFDGATGLLNAEPPTAEQLLCRHRVIGCDIGRRRRARASPLGHERIGFSAAAEVDREESGPQLADGPRDRRRRPRPEPRIELTIQAVANQRSPRRCDLRRAGNN